MIDISTKINSKINSDVGAMAIENYMKPQAEDQAFSKKAESALKVSESHKVKSVQYQRPVEEKEESFSEKLTKENTLDAKNRRDQMAVLSNTTTEGDVKGLEKDGFNLEDEDSRVIVTESDQIRATLAKMGVDVSGYGGSLTTEQLEQMVGSSAVASQIKQTLSEDDIAYMLKNQLEPTIANIYKAQYSSKEIVNSNSQNIEQMTEQDFYGMTQQIEEIIAESGQNVDNLAFSTCKWLINNGFALNVDNLNYVSGLKELNVRPEDIGKAMAQAIEQGLSPEEGILLEGYSPAEKAQKAMETIEKAETVDLEYCISRGVEITIAHLQVAENARAVNLDNTQPKRDKDFSNESVVKAQRQLAEVRLMMTTEANYALIKRGVSIDTKPLEQLVDALKEQEQQYYKDLLQGEGIESSEGNVRSFSDTMTALEQMKGYPAYAISLTTDQETLGSLHREGAALKDLLDKANTSYETMMTAPRKDLGDSITKAFRNVDDILKDLNISVSRESQKAVRILAYNQIDLTEENINQMKAVDEQVQRAFNNLTPKVTLEMIRKGISPLDMTIEQLNQAAVDIKQEVGQDNERFSKYLWKLEQNSQITEEERSAYIGIYRLIAQVEKADSAALGAVINQGSDMTMRNLLTAVRSQNKGRMDYKVDDDFEGITGKSQGPRIDSQIMAGFTKNVLSDVRENLSPSKARLLAENDWETKTPEQLRELVNSQEDQAVQEDQMLEDEYARQQINQLKQVAATESDVYQIMERFDIANTMTNIMATWQMTKNPNSMFKEMMDRVEDLKEITLERFGEAIKTPEELAKATEELAERAAHALDNMILEDRRASHLDLRAMKLASSQLAIAAKKATQSESFVIPVETSDGVVTGVSLKIVRGEEKKGLVDIFMDDQGLGKVAAYFEAGKNGVKGTIVAADQETRALLADNVSLLVANMNKDGQESLGLTVAHIPDISSEKFEIAALHKDNGAKKASSDKVSSDNDSETFKVQTARLYNIAESFINTVKDLTSGGSLVDDFLF